MRAQLMTLAAISCFGCATLLGVAALADAPRDPAKAPAEKAPKVAASACVDKNSEARFNGIAYVHWVHLKNGCKTAVSCSVKTNVNPDAISVSIDVGETQDVMTFMGSPAREFVADVSCAYH